MNNMKKLDALNLRRLHMEEYLALGLSTLELAKTHGLMQDKAFGLMLAELDKQTQLLGKAIDKPRGSALTGALATLDKQRDQLYLELKQGVHYFVKSTTDADKQKAALLLLPYFKTGTSLSVKASDVETARISVLLKTFQDNADFTQALKTLLLDKVVDALHKTNMDFDALYLKRLQENTDIPKGLGQDAKQGVGIAYSAFCKAVEDQLYFAPTEALEKIFHDLNELRIDYRRILAHRPGHKTDTGIDLDLNL
jgi:hypothetical protein